MAGYRGAIQHQRADRLTLSSRIAAGPGVYHVLPPEYYREQQQRNRKRQKVANINMFGPIREIRAA